MMIAPTLGLTMDVHGGRGHAAAAVDETQILTRTLSPCDLYTLRFPPIFPRVISPFFLLWRATNTKKITHEFVMFEDGR